MFDVLTFNMDKFVHMVVKNLSLKIEPIPYKSSKKITFITYIDRDSRIKQQLLHSLEKIRDVYMQQNLDLSNEKDIQYFIEKHTNFLDKFVLLDNRQILTSHLKNINTKILQRVKARRKNVENVKKAEPKALSKNVTCKKKVRIILEKKLNSCKKTALLPASCKEKYNSSHNYKGCKHRRISVLENSKAYSHDVTASNNSKGANIPRAKNYNQKVPYRCNLQNNMINIVNEEIKVAEKYLGLCIEDIECTKKNVEITLYIAKKENYNDTRGQKYNQTLCHHTLLCLIEPSEKAAVLLEDNLPVVIHKHLSRGYKYHFEFQRHSQERYTALLILSQWAKLLLKHANTTMMYTICGILECKTQNILVLCSPEEKLL